MGGAHKTSVPVVVVAFACGLLLGVGVAFGGMTDGRKTSSFFNVTVRRGVFASSTRGGSGALLWA